ncbi:MAG: elongation factor P [Saprospiraceae bacterium]|nr:elongation factor P [Saprospiraceae bacterium]
MASTSDIKKGICFVHNNDIFKVVDFQHVKPGKGAAFVYVKFKSLTRGNVLEQNFPSGHNIDIVRVERRQLQYLYTDDMGMNFMNTESFDQLALPSDMIDNYDLLLEGMMVDVLYDVRDEKALSVELPTHVTMSVTYTEPGVKGDTATNTLKPATVESGAEVKVPLFVNSGDKIRINTETREYMDRVKE